MRRVLTVFIASPSDVLEERAAVRRAVDQINRVTKDDTGWLVDLRGWEDTAPGFSRPQSLINPDVDACDVFIGVLWKRWGQPTGEFSSGFEEEYRRAVARYSGGSGPEIMLYFRDIDETSRRDPGDQLRRVLEFESSTHATRVALTKSYATPTDFEALVFEHLLKILLRLSRSGASTAALNEEPAPSSIDAARARSALPDVGKVPVEESPAGESFLRTPIGIDDETKVVFLDLKDSSKGGAGPHGICIGSTGSGKSELLRTIITSFAMTHPPADITFLLVNGGASLVDLSGLPHVVGIERPDLHDSAGLARVLAGLDGESVRRESMLHEARVASIREYRKRLAEGSEGQPLPYLVVVVDEVAEVLAVPEATDALLRLASVGRSLGVHLLLAGQRIDQRTMRILEPYLSYRIALQTYSKSESELLIGSSDAVALPGSGYAFLSDGITTGARFRSAHVAENTGDSNESLLSQVERRLRGTARGRALLLPPLPSLVTLESMEPALAHGNSEPLRVPVGIIDDIAHVRQSVWEIDIGGADYHAALVGAPGTGKTTFLRTFATALALRYSPSDVTIYGVDASGQGLDCLKGFPHVAGIAGRDEPEEMQQIFTEVQRRIADRTQLMRRDKIPTLRALRERHRSGEVPELVAPDIVMMVDNVGSLRLDFEQNESVFEELLRRGGKVGVHVVCTATRWLEIRPAQQAHIGVRHELRQTESSDSYIDRRQSRMLEQGPAGRALTMNRMIAQVSIPSFNYVGDDLIEDTVVTLATRSAASWAGPVEKRIAPLPLSVAPDRLDAGTPVDGIPLGLGAAGQTIRWDARGSDQHLLVLGDRGSGKTMVLRGIIRELMRAPEGEVGLLVISPSGELIPEVGSSERASAYRRTAEAAEAVARVAAELERRADGNSHDRRRLFVVVDDFDAYSATGGSLRLLEPYLHHGARIRLSLVVARPVKGSSRQFGGPTQTLQDIGAGIVMSGDPSEGAVFRRHKASRRSPGRATWIGADGTETTAQLALWDDQVELDEDTIIA